MSELNATQLLGMTAFAAAALATGLAALTNPQRRPCMAVIAAMYAVLPLEIWKGERHRFGDMLRDILHADHAYSLRRPVQVVVLFIIVVALPIVYRGIRRYAVGAERVALIAVMTIALFALETVSLHYVDAVLYRKIGGVMIIGWCWVALAVAAVSVLSTVD